MKDNKKMLRVVLAAMMVMSLVFSACSKAENPASTAGNDPVRGVESASDPNLVAYNTPLTTFLEPNTGASDPYNGVVANLGVSPAGDDFKPTGFDSQNTGVITATNITFVVTSINGDGWGPNSANGSSDILTNLASVGPATYNGLTYAQAASVGINASSTAPTFASLNNATDPIVIGITVTNELADPHSSTSLTVVIEPVAVVGAIVPGGSVAGVTVEVDLSGYNALFGTSYSSVVSDPVTSGVFAPASPVLNNIQPSAFMVPVYPNTVDDVQISQRYITPISSLTSIVAGSGISTPNVIAIGFGSPGNYSYVKSITVYQSLSNPSAGTVLIDEYTDDNSTPNDYSDDIYYGWQYEIYDQYGNQVTIYDSVGGGAAWVQDGYTVIWRWGIW